MTPQDWSQRKMWFFPSAQRLWEETGTPKEVFAVIDAHKDAIRLMSSGCPRCLVGYADLMADPMFACALCRGTGFPVFQQVSQ